MTACDDASVIDDWVEEARIDAGIVRVRRSGEVRWFIDPDAGADVAAEARSFPHAGPAHIGDVAGLLVPRCPGGLLGPALRDRGGLAPPLALGVLDEVLACLESAPPHAPGTSRVDVRSFAMDDAGAVVLLPGRCRIAAARTDAAELGEILHLALTGRTWEETGMPLHHTAPEVPVAVADLVTSLLEGSDDEADLASLRARIGALGASRDRGFVPGEPGVPDDAAPTATLGADLVAALRSVPMGDGEDAGGEAVGGTRSAVVRRNGERAARPGPRTRRAARRSVSATTRAGGRPGAATLRWGRPVVLMLCGLGVLVGAVLMVRSAQEPEPGADVAHTVATDPADPVPVSEETSEPGAPTDEVAGGEDDPAAAVVDLSRERAEAIAAADSDALTALTAPGSPAAAADAELALDDCGDACPPPRTLELTDVRVRDETSAPADATGETVAVEATMATDADAGTTVLFVLERVDDRWLVHSVLPV